MNYDYTKTVSFESHKNEFLIIKYTYSSKEYCQYQNEEILHCEKFWKRLSNITVEETVFKWFLRKKIFVE